MLRICVKIHDLDELLDADLLHDCSTFAYLEQRTPEEKDAIFRRMEKHFRTSPMPEPDDIAEYLDDIAEYLDGIAAEGFADEMEGEK